MKRIILCTILVITILGSMCACGNSKSENEESIYAIVRLADGTCVRGKVDNYIRWSQANTEISIDGITYEVHPINVTIIREEK